MKDAQAQMAAVQVAIRIRPLTERDRAQPRNTEVLRANENYVQVVSQNKYFTYDHVFGPNTHQSEIFYSLGQSPVQKFIEGYNVTMLAYGQTSSGKTYTMGTAQHTQATDPEEDGIVPRAMELLFEQLQQQQQSSTSSSVTSGRNIRPVSFSSSKAVYKYSVKVSFVEIYNEELIDLLNSAPPTEKPPVTIREDTKGHIYWTGVKEVTVNNTNDILYYLQQGTENRATGSTDMNEKSSRSHAIFSVTLKQERWVPSSPQSSRAASPIPSKLNHPKHQSRLSPASKPTPAQSEDGDWIITNSKFHFVDLAGSERLKRTAAEGDRRKEGININAGLLALGNVISALGDPSKKSTHIPYRDSKLTRLLQDSLGGSAMTLMIACVSPAESNLSETLNTLQYANRARNIKNKIEKNELEEWMTTDNIEMLRAMITKLKSASKTIKPAESDFSDDVSLAGSPIVNPDFDDLYHDQHVLIADLKQRVEELQNEAQFAKERNIVVENELIKLREEKPSDVNFQHLVEPVIEEYEKSISGLESQLAMIRAALSHSDQGFEEQQAKIDQNEAHIQSQEKTINELKRRNAKLVERRMKDETYISELEKKLMLAVEETVHDREMLNDLRGKILKLKEVDENTEQYIHDLEGRLTASELERNELKEKLNQLVTTTKEEASENKIEITMANEESEKRIKELNEKVETSEKERQKLQNQIDQLLLDSKSKAETDQIENKASMDQLTHEKDKRIADLESDLANLQHDYQETAKELDDVLARYEEVLETPSNKDGSAAEVHLLRQSVQHLEHELDLASKREMIFRQMTEEHNASLEVEKTLQKLEGKSDDSQNVALNTFEVLNKKLEYIQAELQLRNIRLENEEEVNVDITTMNTAAMRSEYEAQLLYYKRELKSLTRILKEIKKTKANENKIATANNTLLNNFEYRMLMKTIVSIDKQLTDQYEKMKLEAKRFSNDIIELLPFGHEHMLEQEEQLDSPLPGSPNLMFRQAANHSNRSSFSQIDNVDNEKSRYISTRLSLAKQDLKMHRTMIYALEHKFKMTEISLNTFRKRTENQSVVDIEIEELMSKMDAMKLQFENKKESV